MVPSRVLPCMLSSRMNGKWSLSLACYFEPSGTARRSQGFRHLRPSARNPSLSLVKSASAWSGKALLPESPLRAKLLATMRAVVGTSLQLQLLGRVSFGKVFQDASEQQRPSAAR